ncbi:MAG: hypothetical protein NTX03_09560 [Bacteroidetes bacterium]|nr:hypothetical protein [Bacteroidota bacterium]
MMGAIRRLVVILCCFSFSMASASSFEMNANCKKAYLQIFNYHFKEGEAILQQETKTNPGNLVPNLIYQLKGFLEVFFTEDPVIYKKFKQDETALLKAMNTGPRNTPYANFCRAQSYLYGAIARVKFGDFVDAAYYLQKAYALLDENKKKYPDFLPTDMYLSLMKGAVGTLPNNYRWMLKVIGFSGDADFARQYNTYVTKVEASREFSVFSSEARVICAFIQYHLLNNNDEAWRQVVLGTKDYETSEVAAFCRSSIAIRTKRAKESIKALQPHIKQKPSIAQIDYMMGLSKLCAQDMSCTFYLSRYLEKFKGDNYVKDAYLRLGWAFLLQGDTAYYKSCIKLLKKYGSTRFEEDKSALYEANKIGIPNRTLLKARLLFDGGLYAESKAVLLSKGVNSLSKTEKAEYYYRLAEDNEGLGNSKEALEQYDFLMKNFTTNEGKFVQAACLYTAMIYEKQNNKVQAKAFYQKVLTYKATSYKESFEQKAYAGLKRLE